MKQKLRVLHGHSNWVKNIEYSSKDKLLVSSGFDGSIFTWDINSQTEQGLISQRVFHASGLMRCRISPTGDKLVLCTSGGYIMIIHHLDLTTLHKDLCGFRVRKFVNITVIFTVWFKSLSFVQIYEMVTYVDRWSTNKPV